MWSPPPPPPPQVPGFLTDDENAERMKDFKKRLVHTCDIMNYDSLVPRPFGRPGNVATDVHVHVHRTCKNPSNQDSLELEYKDQQFIQELLPGGS